MIGRLRGVLVGVSDQGIVVEVGGVGYEVAMAPADVAALPGMGDEVVVHTHLYLREDAVFLYGFVSVLDRDLFRVLISASGVGPRVALSLLATLRADGLRRAVLTEDVGALATAPGVGRRSAQKIILELRPKLVAVEAEGATTSTPGMVREALTQLGYGDEEISEVLAEVDASASVPEQVREALRALGRARRA